MQETTLGCSLLLPRVVFPQHKGWRPACTQCWDEEPNFSSGCWVPCGNLLVVLSEIALHPSLPQPPAVLSHGQLQLGCPAGPQQQARPDPWWRKQNCLPWDSCAVPPGARARPAARPQIFPAVAVAIFCSLALSRSLGRVSQVCRDACSSSPVLGRLLHARVLGPGKGFGAVCGRGEVMERSWAPAPRAAPVLSWLQWSQRYCKDGWGCLTAPQCSAPVGGKRMAGGEGPRLAGKVLPRLFPCLHWEQDESPWCWCPAYRGFLGFVMGTLTGMP